jgi:hypothetical protein
MFRFQGPPPVRPKTPTVDDYGAEASQEKLFWTYKIHKDGVALTKYPGAAHPTNPTNTSKPTRNWSISRP